MTVERYNTSNHPRWNSRENTGVRAATASRRRYGRARRYGRRADGRPRTEPPLLLARDLTEDETTIDLWDTSDGVWITAEVPECSLGDVQVTVSGAALRIRVESSGGSSEPVRLDRRIDLARSFDPDDVVIAYDDPELIVIVFHECE